MRDPATGASPGNVVAVDDAACTVDLRRETTSDKPHPRSLVPFDLVPADQQRASLMRIAEWVAERGIDAAGPYQAARDLLRRRPPRVGQEPGSELARRSEDASTAAVRLGLALDSSCLAIQGPPGSGKTHSGAQMILALVAEGRTVGVTANSHKVIGNLLDAVAEEAGKRGAVVRLGQKPEPAAEPTCRFARPFGSNGKVLEALRAGELDVVGGTAWLWSREEFAGALDVLIVDEAGQMSLANTVAVAQAAQSLVLLGDPQQLDQPLKGSHPPGAERSALGHLLDDARTMPGQLGLFLDRTWRLHPDICAYTSEAFYEGRLEARSGLARQALDGRSPLSGSGIRFIPVEHAGNENESPEEAELVADLVRRLVAGDAWWTDREGERHRIGWDDVVIVAAYNAQVAEIAGRLPPAARVGTVDKFQGQEAPISIYSMASSTRRMRPAGWSSCTA